MEQDENIFFATFLVWFFSLGTKFNLYHLVVNLLDLQSS